MGNYDKNHRSNQIGIKQKPWVLYVQSGENWTLLKGNSFIRKRQAKTNEGLFYEKLNGKNRTG